MHTGYANFTSVARSGSALDVVVTSLASDSHTWNLVYLQLLLEDEGHRVLNLGPCVPADLLVDLCAARRPDLVVVSSVNGHGLRDGQLMIRLFRERPELATVPVVIGGKLGVSGPDGGARTDALEAAGFDAVFDEPAGPAPFLAFLTGLPSRTHA